MKKTKFLKLLTILLLLSALLIFDSYIPAINNLINNTVSNTVYAAVAASKISLNKKTLSMKEGETQTLKATITPKNATSKKVYWSSSNKKIVEVSSSGKIKAIKAGRAVITAKTQNGKKALCKVTVTKVVTKVTAIKLDMSSITLDIDDTYTLTASITPKVVSNPELTWTSEDESIVYIDSEGLLLPVETGTAVVTVSSSNGIKASCVVTVTSKEEDFIDNTSDDDYPDEDEYGQEEYGQEENGEEEYMEEDTGNERVTLNPGTYTITLKDTGVCLDVNAASNANGANVQVYQSNNSNAQIWSVECQDDGTVSFIPKCATDKVLDVMRTNNSSTGAIQSGCNVDIYNHNDFPAQHFYCEQFSDGSYVIKLNSNPNLVVQSTSTASGANVIIGTYDENNSLQRWNISATSGLQDVPVVEQRRTAYVYNTGGSGVFVRDQGSTAGSKLGGFAEGQEITVIGNINNSWYKVEGKDRNTGVTINGYAHGDYIVFTKPKESDLGYITSAQIETVISWANARLGSQAYNFLCLAFIGDAFRAAGIGNKGYGYATEAGNAIITNTDTNPPRGAVVFYNWTGKVNGVTKNWGHVGISLGDGKVIHADYDGVKITNLNIDTSRGYRGWGIWK